MTRSPPSLIPAKAAPSVHPASSPVVGVRPVDSRPGAGRKGPPPPCRENCGTTSGRFPNEIKGPSYPKPRGGAPKGNTNALKHGRYAGALLARRAWARGLVRSTNALAAWIRAERKALGLPTHSLEYLFTHRYPDGRCTQRLVMVQFCGRRLLGKTIQMLPAMPGTRDPACRSDHESSSPQRAADRSLRRASAEPSLSALAIAGAWAQTPKARKMGLFRTAARPERKSRREVLTRKQNQPRTISRVSDLFGRDSRPPTEN